MAGIGVHDSGTGVHDQRNTQLANGRTNPGPPEDPRENRGRGGLWKVPSPWEPTAKPARSHGGLEAFGSHTPHSLDGGIAYKPLTRGWVPFTRSGWVLFTLSKRPGARRARGKSPGHHPVPVGDVVARVGVYGRGVQPLGPLVRQS